MQLECMWSQGSDQLAAGYTATWQTSRTTLAAVLTLARPGPGMISHIQQQVRWG
jgi:hypothetical protein